jgi:multiple antibiotic resistance protein
MTLESNRFTRPGKQMSDYLQAIATILSLVNPAICGAIFSKIEVGQSNRSQIVDATKAAVAILVILALAALVGTKLLHAFGISLDAFQVAGGGVLVWMGFSMIRGSDSNSTSSQVEPFSVGKPVLTPLILFAASPGTITGVITLSASHSPSGLPLTSLVAIGTAISITWFVLLVTARMGGPSGGGGLAHDVVTRFMGLIVLAMGVQFALAGVRSFMGTG